MPTLRVRASTFTAAVFAPVANAVDAGDGTYATWTDSSRRGTTSGTFSGFDYSSIPAGSKINRVTLELRHYESSISDVASVTLGGGAVVLSTSPRVESFSRGWTLVTSEEMVWTRGNNTRSTTCYVDWLDVIVDYSLPSDVTQAAYRFYADGSESGSAALAAQDQPYTFDTANGDAVVQLRLRLQSTSVGEILAATDFTLEKERMYSSGRWAALGPYENIDYHWDTGVPATHIVDSPRINAAQFLGTGDPITEVMALISSAIADPLGAVTARIYGSSAPYGDSAARPTDLLASSSNTINCTDLPSDKTVPVSFYFDGPFTPAAETVYFIGLDFTDVTTNSANHGVKLGASGHPGISCQKLGDGAWSYYGSEFLFQIRTHSKATTHDSPSLTDGAATTTRLTGGTGAFAAGKVSEDGLVDDLGWPGTAHTEVLYSIALTAANLSDGDALRFRVVASDPLVTMTYAQTPVINVTAQTVAPTVSLAQDKTTVQTGETVVFTATATGSPAPTLSWALDGGTDLGGSPVKSASWSTPGVKTVTVTATNSAGSAQASKQVTVTEPTFASISTLTDDFASGYAGKWPGTYANSGAITTADGEATIPVSSGVYSALLTSPNKYDCRNGEFIVRWKIPGSGNYVREFGVELRIDANNYVQFYTAGYPDLLRAVLRQGGVTTYHGSVTLPSDTVWVKFSITNSVVTYSYSTDRTNWTVLGTASPTFNMNGLEAHLFAGAWEADGSFAASYGYVNVAPPVAQSVSTISESFAVNSGVFTVAGSAHPAPTVSGGALVFPDRTMSFTDSLGSYHIGNQYIRPSGKYDLTDGAPLTVLVPTPHVVTEGNPFGGDVKAGIWLSSQPMENALLYDYVHLQFGCQNIIPMPPPVQYVEFTGIGTGGFDQLEILPEAEWGTKVWLRTWFADGLLHAQIADEALTKVLDLTPRALPTAMDPASVYVALAVVPEAPDTPGGGSILEVNTNASWPGPAVIPGEVWNGTRWVAPEVWNGTRWVPGSEVEVFNGTAWVPMGAAAPPVAPVASGTISPDNITAYNTVVTGTSTSTGDITSTTWEILQSGMAPATSGFSALTGSGTVFAPTLTSFYGTGYFRLTVTGPGGTSVKDLQFVCSAGAPE